ncbi:MAG: Zn-ribbon domain-containing OB-fold protein [Candidatus Bathyarchaeia archaeon]
MKTEVPIMDGLFEWPSQNPRLIASKCQKCGSIQFPKSNVCNNPDCDHSAAVEECFLSNEGTLYTYTLHAYSLREPFQYHTGPYIVGAIELPEGITVVSRIKVSDEKLLRIGMKMKLKIDKLYEDEEKAYMSYFFEPVV